MNKSSITVLLIEDNPGDARLIRELLDQETSPRFELAHTADLETGLERLAQGGIDVALVDLSLPDSLGFDTFNQVHAHSPEVPIVVLTGLKDEAVAAKTLRAGGQDFLNKSLLDLSVLDQTLRHAMERKPAEELHDAKHAVEPANRVHDQFLAVLSEELREGLTSLLMTVSTLMDEPNAGAGRLPVPDLAMIRFQLELQRRLIDEILAYVRVGTRGTAFEPTDCDTVVEGTLVNLKPWVDKTGAVVTHDPLPCLWADSAQMWQLFQNLICNAIKYRAEPSPRIHIAAERQGEEWVFSICDNGIGFDPERAEPIFTIFRRLHDHDDYPGTGISLATCKKIVERHGGRIWAESEPGRGSRFLFTMPARAGGAR